MTELQLQAQEGVITGINLKENVSKVMIICCFGQGVGLLIEEGCFLVCGHLLNARKYISLDIFPRFVFQSGTSFKSSFVCSFLWTME